MNEESEFHRHGVIRSKSQIKEVANPGKEATFSKSQAGFLM